MFYFIDKVVVIKTTLCKIWKETNTTTYISGNRCDSCMLMLWLNVPLNISPDKLPTLMTSPKAYNLIGKIILVYFMCNIVTHPGWSNVCLKQFLFFAYYRWQSINSLFYNVNIVYIPYIKAYASDVGCGLVDKTKFIYIAIYRIDI